MSKRQINKIIIHCSATTQDMDIGVSEIKRWHLQRGWSDIGYHEVIRRNGSIEEGRPAHVIGAHTKGHNEDSIGICLVGGVDNNMSAVDNFTPEQWRSLERLLTYYLAQYPKATIHGHNEFAAKACPSFNVQEWLHREDL